MRVTFVAVGTRGDVQPYLALAVGLKAAGYETRIATHLNFQALVESCGLDFAPLPGDIQAMMGAEVGHQVMDAGSNVFLNMARLYGAVKPMIYELVQATLDALADTDLAIGSALGYNVAYGPALKRGLRLYGAFVQPMYATAEYQFPMFPAWPKRLPLPRLYNRASYALFYRMIWLIASRVGMQAYEKILDLPRPRFANIYGAKMVFPPDTLFGYSPRVVPKPREWPDTYHITGYWHSDQPPNAHTWQPTAALQRFLDSGAPPVYIGFGSMSTRQPEQIAALTIKALQATGQRGLLLTGWHGLEQTALPDTVFKIESAPHDWLFPRMAALVHHGGSGTTGAAFRAGLPQIVVPFSFEQPFWGSRTYALGIGAKPIPRRRLTAEKLAQAIDQVVHDGAMQQRAKTLGALISAEDGVGQAVAVIQSWLGATPRPD